MSVRSGASNSSAGLMTDVVVATTSTRKMEDTAASSAKTPAGQTASPTAKETASHPASAMAGKTGRVKSVTATARQPKGTVRKNVHTPASAAGKPTPPGPKPVKTRTTQPKQQRKPAENPEVKLPAAEPEDRPLPPITPKVQGTPSIVSGRSHSSRAVRELCQLKLQQLAEEKALEDSYLEQRLAEKKSLDAAYLAKKYELLAEEAELCAESGGSTTSSCTRRTNRTHEWVESTRATTNEAIAVATARPPSLAMPGAVQMSSTVAEQPTAPFRPERQVSWLQYSDQFQLSTSQIQARKAVSRELPTFKGEPEGWPMFIAGFHHTTHMCGYTPEENIVRLQSSLKGKALDTVRALLMHPENVDQAIETLKTRFGQPEIIVHQLIDNISRLPPIRDDNPEALMDFAVQVQNLCSTAKACEMNEHMYNITLLHQLVQKLSPTLRLNWAEQRTKLGPVSLTDFSAWAFSLAKAVHAVSYSLPRAEEASKVAREVAHPRRRGNPSPRPEYKVFTNAHTERAVERCTLCKADCPGLADCEQFRKLTWQGKWDFVKRHRRCFNCLAPMHGRCNRTSCAAEECPGRHHTLLHKHETEVDAKRSENVSGALSTKITSQLIITKCEWKMAAIALSTKITSQLIITKCEHLNARCNCNVTSQLIITKCEHLNARRCMTASNPIQKDLVYLLDLFNVARQKFEAIRAEHEVTRAMFANSDDEGQSEFEGGERREVLIRAAGLPRSSPVSKRSEVEDILLESLPVDKLGVQFYYSLVHMVGMIGTKTGTEAFTQCVEQLLRDSRRLLTTIANPGMRVLEISALRMIFAVEKAKHSAKVKDEDLS
ncbi:uncharacterized protein LOC126576558 [Anopheles aquasalis]|uniref:uncharacterized protein LOC126576558 n=1 Tax=Anopheles aquasalis TaxID=42839 RepID=UPI00215A8A90|nr:uncharacterized protein LOC126576558 [Anopheles aquasalis]